MKGINVLLVITGILLWLLSPVFSQTGSPTPGAKPSPGTIRVQERTDDPNQPDVLPPGQPGTQPSVPTKPAQPAAPAPTPEVVVKEKVVYRTRTEYVNVPGPAKVVAANTTFIIREQPGHQGVYREIKSWNSASVSHVEAKYQLALKNAREQANRDATSFTIGYTNQEVGKARIELQEYVDNKSVITLRDANAYTDKKVDELKANINPPPAGNGGKGDGNAPAKNVNADQANIPPWVWVLIGLGIIAALAAWFANNQRQQQGGNNQPQPGGNQAQTPVPPAQGQQRPTPPTLGPTNPPPAAGFQPQGNYRDGATFVRRTGGTVHI